MFSSNAWAGPIDAKQALEVAQEFFSVNGFRSATNEFTIDYIAPNLNKGEEGFRSATAVETQEAENLYYVINRGKNKGYIVVAGDERVVPVFAYSFEGRLSAEDIQGHPSINYMFEEYKRQVAWALKNVPNVKHKDGFRAGGRRMKPNEVKLAPLLAYYSDRKTRRRNAVSFGQAWPFNRYCPNVNIGGTNYPTVSGCVATAISTLMRWHEWPNKPNGTVGYNWRGTYLSVNLDQSSGYDWKVMPEAVTSGGVNRATGRTCTDSESDQIGRLLRDVGYSIRMSYDAASRGGSGTQVWYAVEPLSKNFGYKKSVKWIARKNYNASNWWWEVKDELDTYGPVIYAGFSAGGGHCFNFDGYGNVTVADRYGRNRTYDYVHVDWGWTAKENGWYVISTLEPGSQGIGGGRGGYSNNQQMLRYVLPNRRGNPNPRPNPRPNPNPEPKPEPKPRPEVKNFTLRMVEGTQIEDFEAEVGTTPAVNIKLKNIGNAVFDGKITAYLSPEGGDAFKEYFEVYSTKTYISDKKDDKSINLYLTLNKDKVEVGKTYHIYVAHDVPNANYQRYIRENDGTTPQVFGHIKIKKGGWNPDINPNPNPEPEPKPDIEPKPDPQPNPDVDPDNEDEENKEDKNLLENLSVITGKDLVVKPVVGQRLSFKVVNKGDKGYYDRFALYIVKKDEVEQIAEKGKIIATGTTFLLSRSDVDVDFNADLSSYEEGEYSLFVAFRDSQKRWRILHPTAMNSLRIQKKDDKKEEPRKKVAELALSRTVETLDVEEGSSPIVSVWIANSGKKDYRGQIKLFAAKRSKQTSNDNDPNVYLRESQLILLVSGPITLEAGVDNEVKFHPVPSKVLEGQYDLCVVYYNENNEKRYLSTDIKGSKRALKIGEFNVFAKKEDKKDKPYLLGVKLKKVKFYQNGAWLTGQYPRVKYFDATRKFTTRLYLDALEGFTKLKLRALVVNYSTLKPVQGLIFERYIRMKSGQTGYIDVTFKTEGLYQNWHRVAVQYWDPNHKIWLTYPNTSVPFYVDYRYSYGYNEYRGGIDTTPNDGVSVKVREAVKHIGTYSKKFEEDAPELDVMTEEEQPDDKKPNENTTTAINDVNSMKVRLYPTETSDVLNLVSPIKTLVNVYDMNGRIVMSKEVEAGTTSLSVASLTNGMYILRIAGQNLRFVRR